MIALIILVAGSVYVLVLIAATRIPYRWAKKSGWPKWKCRAVAACGFLLVYLPVFWDHIPTLVTYHYACATRAGFWEPKTIETWNSENPGVAKTLVAPSRPTIQSEGDQNNYVAVNAINQRINLVSRKIGPLPVNLWRWESELVDSKSGDVLAKSIDFSAGDGRVGGDFPTRFWLQFGFCRADGSYYYMVLSRIEQLNRLSTPRGEK